MGEGVQGPLAGQGHTLGVTRSLLGAQGPRRLLPLSPLRPPRHWPTAPSLPQSPQTASMDRDGVPLSPQMSSPAFSQDKEFQGQRCRARGSPRGTGAVEAVELQQG